VRVQDLAREHIVGFSGPFTDLTVAPRYFDEAETARWVAGRRHDRGSGRTVVRLDDVDFATWLMACRDDRHVSTRFDRDFGPLVTSPDLVETVVTYLSMHQDVPKTAKRLFVHPSTVRYRLRNVEQLVGGPITSAKVVTNLYLAFQDEIVAYTAADEVSSRAEVIAE
jgi:PucR family transcriptional regulator, purine catabolism regulatory protein